MKQFNIAITDVWTHTFGEKLSDKQNHSVVEYAEAYHPDAMSNTL